MHRIGMTLAGALLFAATGAAAAEPGRGYVSAAAGLAALADLGADSATFQARIDTENTVAGVLAVGRHFGDIVRGELELSYTKHDADEVSGAPAIGEVTGLGFGGNLLADFNLPTLKITPYVGLGVGFIRADLNAISPVGGSVLDGSSTVPYVQALAGASYPLSDRLSLFGDLRIRGSERIDLTTSAGAAVSPNFSDRRVMVGLRWRFGAQTSRAVAAPAPSQPVAAAAAPSPRPPPSPPRQTAAATPPAQPASPDAESQRLAEIPREYLVFFDWDRADITTEAAEIIATAAANAEEVRTIRLTTTGHADRSGPDTYNLRLSLRRAEAVRAALVQRGVSSGEIEIFARGESEPLVQTPDGVREPRNRRV
ncbi:MAG: OmpA family protein, partial [Alphaproteobacteria bacterium]|nr:OmpA family protein [Alphaproteobacteria bacterium]